MRRAATRFLAAARAWRLTCGTTSFRLPSMSRVAVLSGLLPALAVLSLWPMDADALSRRDQAAVDALDKRMAAAQFVSQRYYNQHPRLLEFVLSKPPDRVTYNNLALQRENFEEIARLGKQSEILEGTVTFDDYVDVHFGEAAEKTKKAYGYEAEKALMDLNGQ